MNETVIIYVNKDGLKSITNGKNPAQFEYSQSANFPISVQISLKTLQQWNVVENGNSESGRKLLFD